MISIEYILTEVPFTNTQFITKKTINNNNIKYKVLFYKPSHKKWLIIDNKEKDTFINDPVSGERLLKTYTEEEFVNSFFFVLLKKS